MNNISIPQLCVFIGTKAQYIKTAPLMRLMQENGVDYRLVDSGQHADFARSLRKELSVKEPDAIIQDTGNLKTVPQVALWLLRFTFMAIFQPRKVRSNIFGGMKEGICIIHGDTPSTLLSLLLAKRAGLKVAHIEAGLRSHNLLKPFPEEIVRLITMRMSDYLFAPSDWAYDNLVSMGVKGSIYNARQNTNVEALYYSLQDVLQENSGSDQPAYALMTVHRVETILRPKRLEFVLRLAERIAKERRLIFILHPPTEKKLEDFGMKDRIMGNPQIEISRLVGHSRFLESLANAEFVVTDGGSIQEESYYLDVPCLLIRSETERQDGIGGNVAISAFDQVEIDRFLENYKSMRKGQCIENIHASKYILNILLEEIR